ncbi:MAG: FlgD immunoglobulin-like domain containing protein [Bacteroidota bacterium]
MRRCLLLVCFCLLAPPSLGQEVGTWDLLPDSPFHSYRFEDASFLNPDTGWIVNGAGEVFRTDDAGETWTMQADLPAYLRATAFVSERRGFIGTLNESNVLYGTDDGGATFVDLTDRITGPRPVGICGMWAVNEDVVYGAGWYAAPAHFVKTTDGGQTWTSRSMDDYAASLVDVYFWDEQRGIAVGGTDGFGDGSAVVLLTEDGGETWNVQYTSSGSFEWAWKISFPTPTTGYVSLEGAAFPAKVLKTTDAGLTWTELTIPGSSDLQGLGFISEDMGWASGRGTTSVTTDGGQTWAPVDLDGSVNRFEFFGDSLGYAMGRRIYAYEPPAGTSPTEDELVPTLPVALGVGYPNPSAAGAVTIPYWLETPVAVELAVFDVLGRRLAVLAEGTQPAGAHQAVWAGSDAQGQAVAPGIYVVRLAAGDQHVARTLVRVQP